jgi:adenylylsulfate kinase-like enzyme
MMEYAGVVLRSLRERRRCVVVLLCGTSGSGKSTLASILVSSASPLHTVWYGQT